MSRASKFNGPFIPVPRWVLKFLNGDPTTLMVLVYSMQYMDNDTQQLTTSYDHIAEITGTSRRTVIRCMNKLVDLGVVRKVKRLGKNGNNKTNAFIIDFNTPLAKVREGDTGDTLGGDMGVTRGVTRVTPSGGDTGDTQSIKTNPFQEGAEGKTVHFLSDPRWQKQFKMSKESE
jgi:hypothetical protein